MGISGRSALWNRPELNCPFTTLQGEVRPMQGARFRTEPSFRVSDEGSPLFLAAGWNKAAHSNFDTTGSNLARRRYPRVGFSHLI